MSQFKDNECLLTTQKHCLCIEFILSDKVRQGFHQGQILHYRLEPNDDTDNRLTPERLSLAFSTADVVILGRCLERITTHLADGDLRSVRVLPTRFADLDTSRPFIAFISIEPIRKE